MIFFPPNTKPNRYIESAAIVGYILANELDINEQNSFANWLELVAQVMYTYAAQVTLLQAREDEKKQEEKKKKQENEGKRNVYDCN